MRCQRANPKAQAPGTELSVWLGRLCRQALLAEAELTPKPGLVDRRGPGAHHDMNLDMFRLSATSLEPYFVTMAQCSEGEEPSAALRRTLGSVGRESEKVMFAATGGVNTHKGAIWTLGLLTSAAASLGGARTRAAEIAEVAAAIARHADEPAPRLVTHGNVVLHQFGLTGAREEAQRGFPHVISTGLPALRDARGKRHSETAARLTVLMELIARVDDTCLVHRGGVVWLRRTQAMARAVLERGGITTPTGRARFEELDSELASSRLSPGGSADLLAATLLLDAIENGRTNLEADSSTDSSEGTTHG